LVKAVVKVPFFAKLTPNVTEPRLIARAAHQGGATGVTAINTVSGLMGLKTSGAAWPAVGKEKKTTYGGVSGNATRPIGLKFVSSIARDLPNYPIMGVGGIDSADTAIQFLYAGAGVVQICSAVQNQDFTVVQDYITGLQAHLYMQSRPDLSQWDGQSPPKGEVPSGRSKAGRGLPKFGHFEKQRQKLVSESCLKTDILEYTPDTPAPAPVSEPPKIKDQVGRALSRIGQYNDLDNQDQVVALVDEELCINCGKCYMTCNDSGYQAIKFDPDTHIPHITEDCTGCTLCVSVCPIIDCISMVPRKIPYKPLRGIEIPSS